MSSLLPSHPLGKTVLPLATAAVWMLAAAGIAFWVLHWPQADTAMAAPVAAAQPASADTPASVARALGQTAPVTASLAESTRSNFKLWGVIASPSGQGSALIATDGQPPKAYRVGQTVQEGWTLVSLTARQARLASSTTQVVLDLPAANTP